MIRSIKIENLRGIKKGKLNDFTGLVVLVGPNGSGKSTILDALLIGAGPTSWEAIVRAVKRHKGIKRAARWLIWRPDESVTSKIEVGAAEDSRASHLKLEQQTSDASLLIRYWTKAPHIAGTKGVVAFRPDESTQHSGGGANIEVVPDLRFVETYAHEQTPLHALYSRAVEQGRREQALALLQALIPGLKNLEILTEEDAPVIHLVFQDYSVPVALAGDGIHSLLRLALELAARPRGLVLVEEPEIHQHPGAIRQSARAILAAIRREIQVVLSTHSLELIDALLAEASDEDLEKLSLYRLQLDNGILKSHRSAGPEVARVRTEIEDDLR